MLDWIFILFLIEMRIQKSLILCLKVWILGKPNLMGANITFTFFLKCTKKPSLLRRFFILFCIINCSCFSNYINFNLSRIFHFWFYFSATSLAIITIWLSETFSGFTINLISRPACTANDFSTPSKESAISSSFSNLLMYVSNVSLLAPGLDADIASAAWTSTASIVFGSTSPWCAWTAFIITSLSLYF